MLKRTLTTTLLVSFLVILLGGQALAASYGEVIWDSNNNVIRLQLVDEKQAVAIAKEQVGARSLKVESARLVIFRSSLAWEITLHEESRRETITHQVWVNLLNGKVLEHRAKGVETPRPPVTKPKEVDQKEAIKIARGEVVQEVDIKAVAHMKNSRIWVVNMLPKGIADSTERIYVMINQDNGEIIERGWIKDGKSHVARVGKERALRIAERQINYKYTDASVGLTLKRNTLAWEIRLHKEGNRNPASFLLDAFTGEIIAQKNVK
ncbi:MAG: PepSY domain-containing protein [bacterium]